MWTGLWAELENWLKFCLGGVFCIGFLVTNCGVGLGIKTGTLVAEGLKEGENEFWLNLFGGLLLSFANEKLLKVKKGFKDFPDFSSGPAQQVPRKLQSTRKSLALGMMKHTDHMLVSNT